MTNANFTPPADPWPLFQEWFALAEAQETNNPNAMSLATVGEEGMPSVRILLLSNTIPMMALFFIRTVKAGRGVSS